MRAMIQRAIQRYVGLAAGAALVAGIAAQETGCSSPAAEGPPTSPTGNGNATEETGSVGMQLTIPGGETLSTIQWIVSGPSGIAIQSGSVSVQASLTVSFVVAGLAAPSSYAIALSGTTRDGRVTCSGSAQFSVSAHATTNVTDLLQCNPAAALSEAGAAAISALTYDCAAIAAVAESPSETTVGSSVAFTATTNAANPGAATYLWSAPSGTFSTPNAASTNFSCAAAGSVPVTLTVGDGPVPDGAACNPALTTQTFQVQCDPGNCGALTSFAIAPSSGEVFVGETVTLTATATGPDPVNLGYSWTQASSSGAAIGVLGTAADEAAGPSDPNTFLCTAPGTATITVTVDDGPTPDGGACPSSVTTATKTVTCDPFPAGQVEAAWVELGPGGSPVARALTAAAACPNITLNGTARAMNLRIGSGTEPLRSTNSVPLGPQFSKPSVFPINTCEFALPPGTTSAVVAGRALPLPKTNPTSMVVIGDTGCRLKAANPASGSQYQGCNDPTQYPFQQLATFAASLNPDVVMHVGDYQYRENECPPDQANCAGSPWGYGWDTWEADFFQPAANLLAAAPWIVVRGNHEQCTRAGQGWYRFLDPNPYSEAHSCNSAANDAVLQPDGTLLGGSYNAPYAVPLGPNSQIIVFDSNNVGTTAVTPGGTSNFLTYQTELQAAGAFATTNAIYNIWTDHHPILGFAPNAGAPPSPGNLDLLSVMAATYPDTYFPPNVNLALHGHTHLFEGIDFTSTNYPATFVTGNAGTLLDIALPDPFPSATVHPDPAGDATVSTIADSAGFGLLFMQYTGGVWTVTEYRIDGSIRSVCTVHLNGQMTCTVNNFIN